MTQTSNRSVATKLAFAVPLVIIVVGGVISANQPVHSSDWFAMARILPFLATLALAAMFSVALAVVAFVRREPRAALVLFIAGPSALLLSVAAVIVLDAQHDDHLKEKQAAVVERLVREPALREEFVSRTPLDRTTASLLLSHKVQDLLTPDQVTRIWERRKDLDIGQHYRRLIGPAYTPPAVLREYYERLMTVEERRDGARSYRSLVFQTTLLRHRNLPRDIIDELLASGVEDVVAHLARNPQLTSEPAYLRRWANVPPLKDEGAEP